MIYQTGKALTVSGPFSLKGLIIELDRDGLKNWFRIGWMKMNSISAVGRRVAATQSPLSSRIALKIMEEGGNVVDAAVTASLLLSIVEPGWNGIGGGGFALIYSEDMGAKALDYRETAPSGINVESYQNEEDMSTGYKAVAVPGTLKGLWTLHQELGEYSWKKIIDTVEKYAESTTVSRLWSKCMYSNVDNALHKIKLFRESRETFLREGEVYVEGSIIKQRKLSLILQRLREDVQDFYEGELAEKIQEEFHVNNGYLSVKDLSGYKPVWREPIATEVELNSRSLKVLGFPLPGSSILVMHGLKITPYLELDRKDYYLELAYLLTHLIRERSRRICDPLFYDGDPLDLLSEEQIQQAVDSMETCTHELLTDKDTGGTSHISILDGSRKMCISLTETIECFMGSGLTINGVLFNDEIHDFEIEKNHPNSIYPGKRPASSMSPIIILNEENVPEIVIGASGGYRIISAITQTLLNYLIRKLDPVTSILKGRIHVKKSRIVVEDSLKNEVLRSILPSRFSVSEVREVSMYPGTDLYFGAVQAVFKKNDKYIAVSDPRKQPGACSKT